MIMYTQEQRRQIHGFVWGMILGATVWWTFALLLFPPGCRQ